MQRAAGNQATMRAIAAGASPTPPADGENPKGLPSAPPDDENPDDPVLKPSARPPGTDDPSFTNATGAPGAPGPDRPRG